MFQKILDKISDGVKIEIRAYSYFYFLIQKMNGHNNSKWYLRPQFTQKFLSFFANILTNLATSCIIISVVNKQLVDNPKGFIDQVYQVMWYGADANYVQCPQGIENKKI